ncbi:hypothetical protein GCM10009674_30960 [Nesterenkonia xinjiangensis]
MAGSQPRVAPTGGRAVSGFSVVNVMSVSRKNVDRVSQSCGRLVTGASQGTANERDGERGPLDQPVPELGHRLDVRFITRMRPGQAGSQAGAAIWRRTMNVSGSQSRRTAQGP